MKPAPIADKALLAASRASCVNSELVLRAGGMAVSKETRDEMLRKCAAGEYVELELDVMAFEQRPGVSNRNFVRFRDGAVMALARSGVGTPFLRDHDQWDSMARGGTVLASVAEKRGEGDYAIKQTVKLTAPWAVELALRGLMSTVSIGWNPTGAVQCSVCSQDFWRCSHYPGERYAKDGADAPVVCERIYTAADLVETSAVPVPAVPAAQIDEIRAALSALPFDPSRVPTTQKERTTMSTLAAIAAILSLPTTAGESDILKAVESQSSAKKLVEQQRDDLATQLVAANAKLTGFQQTLGKQNEDKFIDDAVRAGKLVPASPFETALRAYHAKDPEGAKALVASSPVVTPVGAPLQSGAQPVEPPAMLGVASAKVTIEKHGGSLAGVRKNLKDGGYTDKQIDDMLARHVGGVVKEA